MPSKSTIWYWIVDCWILLIVAFLMEGKHLNLIKGKYLNLMRGKYFILENRASQPRIADPPTPGQNPHEMGRRKSFRSILGGKLYRIPARIDLDRSRPLKLNFSNPYLSKKMSKKTDF